MDYIGGIEGINFKPISGYNKYLKTETAFDADTNSEFEDILNKQLSTMQGPQTIQGGVEMSTNFDNLFAQNPIQSAEAASPTGNFLDSISQGIGNGLESVNQKVNAADKAQEAFAMGEDVSVHDVMIAAEKASLSLQMAMQLRNKLVGAYNEIKELRV